MGPLIRTIRTLLCLPLFCPAGWAQQFPAASSDSQQNPENQQRQSEKPESPSPKSGTSNDRLFFALPNFLTLENAGEAPPLTSKEKFKVVARSSFDYVQVPWWAFLAGISQARNSQPGYGQGAAGYAKRFGATAADGTIEDFMTGAVLPSLLRQDPRYFQCGKGSFWHRASYALSRIVLTRSDSGATQFNYSEVFGSALSAGISTYSYHPRADRTLSNTGKVWASQLSYDSLSNLTKEFWPDIRRKLERKKTEPD